MGTFGKLTILKGGKGEEGEKKREERGKNAGGKNPRGKTQGDHKRNFGEDPQNSQRGVPKGVFPAKRGG